MSSTTHDSRGGKPLLDKLDGALHRVGDRLGKALYATGVRSTRHLTLPDFVGIGLMKCGTTWLYENLRAHPGVFVSERKELRYFSNHFQTPLADYAANFADAGDRIAGEISPVYATLPERRIRFLKKVMPDVRLILLLRDPVEREWSRIHHHLTKSGHSVLEVPEDEVLRAIGEESLLRQGGYTGVIDRWLEHFPEEQLFIGFHDDIRDRPKSLLEDVFRFLGVTTDLDWDTLPFRETIIPPYLPELQGHDPWRGVSVAGYQSSEERFPARYREVIARMYQDELRELERRFGARVQGWLEPHRVT